MKSLLAAMLVVLSMTPAVAQPRTADQMTCEQAISFYERNRYIDVLANRTDPVRVRTGVPVNLVKGSLCSGRSAVPQPYMIRTIDDRRCVISIFCSG